MRCSRPSCASCCRCDRRPTTCESHATDLCGCTRSRNGGGNDGRRCPHVSRRSSHGSSVRHLRCSIPRRRQQQRVRCKLCYAVRAHVQPSMRRPPFLPVACIGVVVRPTRDVAVRVRLMSWLLLVVVCGAWCPSQRVSKWTELQRRRAVLSCVITFSTPALCSARRGVCQSATWNLCLRYGI